MLFVTYQKHAKFDLDPTANTDTNQHEQHNKQGPILGFLIFLISQINSSAKLFKVSPLTPNFLKKGVKQYIKSPLFLMQAQCTWTQFEMLRPLCSKSPTTTFFTFSKHFQKGSDSSFFRTNRRINKYPSFMATISTVSTQKDPVSTQDGTPQITQQPLQVRKTSFFFIIIDFGDRIFFFLFFLV